MFDSLSRWWHGISLRTKVTGVTVLLLTTGLVIAGVGTMAVLRSYLLAETDSKLRSQAAVVAQALVENGSGQVFTPGMFASSYYYGIIGSDGSVIDDNLEDDDPRKPVFTNYTPPEDLSGLAEGETISNSTFSTQWRIVDMPVQVQENSNVYTLVVGLNLQETNATLNQFAAIFFGFALSVVVLGGALTRLLVTSTFEPLRDVERTAARIAAGDLSQRLDGATPNTEVGRLNRSLNTMLGRIDRAFADRARTIEQMRRFVGDASHELRTPLVSLRGYAELYRMGALQKDEDVAQAMERIEKEAIRMSELVRDLLELARIDETKPLQLGPVDLGALARDAALDAMAFQPDRDVMVIVADADTSDEHPSADVETDTDEAADAPLDATSTTGPRALAGATLARLRRRAGRTARRVTHQAPTINAPQIRLEPGTATSPVVQAEENKIRQVVTNLLGNAMRFTPADTPIELRVGADRRRGLGVIDVIDHGEGIPPQVREKIFQRFWRADSSRNRDTGGSGLGLAIVSAIVSAHQGSVDVFETEGGGATFRVMLPLLPTAGGEFTAHGASPEETAPQD